MVTKVKDMTIDELRDMISNIVKSSMEPLIEDYLALSSDNYKQSIKEARDDYKNGRYVSIEDIDV